MHSAGTSTDAYLLRCNCASDFLLHRLFDVGRISWVTTKRSMMQCPKVLLGRCGPSPGG